MTDAISALGPLSEYIPHTNLTKVQEKVIPSLINSQQNVIVAAPTGSGKTVLLEVAMLRLFRSRLLCLDGGSAPDSTTLGTRQKAVYICPIKALANEKYELWKEKFPRLAVIIETGDQEREKLDRDSLTSVSEADIIITTPERWDSITRRWKEKTVMEVVHSVGLLLLDEIHTVHEERGAALEAVVSRMKAIGSAAQSTEIPALASAGARFVAISGTLPNIRDF
ncbi:RNA helicase, partial [Strigomonas culicis]